MKSRTWWGRVPSIGAALVWMGYLAGTVVAQEGAAPPGPGAGIEQYVIGADPLVRESSAYISFDFKDKDLHEVLRFISSRVGVNIVADSNVTETVTATFDKVEWRHALDVIAEQTNCKIVEVSDRLIRFTQPPAISMEFQDADIKVVLELLAKQAGVNIVMSSDIRGKVSLSLREVPWREALDTLVKTAGYVLVREEASIGTEILRVVPPEALRQQLQIREFALKYVRPPEPYVAQITNIDTVARTTFSPETAAPVPTEDGTGSNFHLENALRQVVSEDGRLTYDPGTNTFIVKDIKPKLDEIEQIIRTVDVPPPLIYVEVKFIRTTNTDIFERGVRFDDPATPERDGLQANVRFAEPREFVGDLIQGAPIDDPLRVFGGTFPFDIGRSDLDALGVTGFQALALLDFTETQLFLKLVRDDEHSRVVQEPTLTMVNNRPAVIFVGETIPFAVQEIQQDQNGNITVAIEENERSPINVGFTLYITPHVVPGTDQIDLSVIPRVSTLSGTTSTIAGFERFSFAAPGSSTESFIDLPREAAQTVVTYMRVQDGQTAVIGGLQTERRTEIESRVPLLSSVPILGNLFTWKRKQTNVESLVILITPRILKDVGHENAVFSRAIGRHKKSDYFYRTYEEPYEEKPQAAEPPDAETAREE